MRLSSSPTRASTPTPFRADSGHVRLEAGELLGLRELRRDLLGRREVDLAHDEHERRARCRAAASTTKRSPGPTGGVRLDDDAHHVDLGERRERALVRSLTEQRARLVHTGSVEEHDLVGRCGADAADLVARRLRLVGDDRDLAPDDAVHERRLADVGPADDRDETRMERRDLVAHAAPAFGARSTRRDGAARLTAPAACAWRLTSAAFRRPRRSPVPGARAPTRCAGPARAPRRTRARRRRRTRLLRARDRAC